MKLLGYVHGSRAYFEKNVHVKPVEENFYPLSWPSDQMPKLFHFEYFGLRCTPIFRAL